jgi:thiol:disulfide interchange protein DsbD
MSAGAQRGGFIGAILMGMVTGLVASPCIGPVLVVLLTFAAKGGNLFMGFWLLFTYAVGLGMLFLVLGTFAGALSALPGAGAWMDTIKHVFGVILLGMAIFFLRTVIGPQWIRFLLGVYLVFVGVIMGAFSPVPAGLSAGRMLGKAAGILVFVSGVVIFLLWLLVITGAPRLLLPAGQFVTAGGPATGLVVSGQPDESGTTYAEPQRTGRKTHVGPAWKINDLTALPAAATAGRPLIQDFYADWCGACVELDEKTWSDPAVIAESRRFVNLKMDFTRKGDFQKNATARFGLKGMPTVILYDSQGREASRFVGFKPPAEVLALMKAVP